MSRHKSGSDLLAKFFARKQISAFAKINFILTSELGIYEIFSRVICISIYSIAGFLSYRYIDDQSIWQHYHYIILMRFVTGGHVWKFLLEHFCIKLGSVRPEENSQCPNITHFGKVKTFFSQFPSFITTTAAV